MQFQSTPNSSGRSRFPDTRWSLVVEAASHERSNQALEELCRNYWYPLYAFARRRGLPEQDAQDVTQGFFADILRREDLSKVAPERGRFRSFMLTGLKNYISNEFRNRKAAKRGGDAIQLSLEVDFEDRYLKEPAEESTPETLFQRSWGELDPRTSAVATGERVREGRERGAVSVFARISRWQRRQSRRLCRDR